MKIFIFSKLKRQKILIGLLFFSSLFLIFSGNAKAYEIENYQEKVEDRFVISPANLELSLSPGESTTQKMTIVNRLGRTATFSVSKEDFVGSDDPDKATVFLDDESAGITSAKNWVLPETYSFTLNQGDRISLPLEIKAPDNAVAGSHYAAVFASVAGEESEAKDKVKLISRVGMLVLINIAGENRESGEITEFKTDKKFYKNGPINFSTVFKNTGNIYERVKGEISIKNILGSEIGRVSLKEWVVLSDSSRRQTGIWDRKWLLGKYTAHLETTYGLGGNLKDNKDVVFYVFPWHIALIILLVLIVLFYLFKYIFGKIEIRLRDDKKE